MKLGKLKSGVGQQASPYLQSLEEQSDEEEILGVPNAGGGDGNEEDVLGSSDDDGPVKVLGSEVCAPSPSKKRKRVQDTAGTEKESSTQRVQHAADWKKIQDAEDDLTELLVDEQHHKEEEKSMHTDNHTRSQVEQDLRKLKVSQLAHQSSNQTSKNT